MRVLMIVLAVCVACVAEAADFYVTPTGSSIQSVVAEVRAFKQSQPPTEPITVWLADGTYAMTAPLALTQADSGSEAFPITYQAEPYATVILDGGTRSLFLTNTSWVIFKGLTLTNTSDVTVVVEGASTHLTFDSLHIYGGSNNAVSIREGGGQHLIRQTVIHDMDRSGIWVTSGNRQTLGSGGVILEHNDISAIGLVQTDATAIGVNGVGTIVRNNHLHHVPHFAIQLDGNNHVVELNEIDHSNLQTTDSGAIYMGRSWVDRGNVIRYNHLHDIQPMVGGAVMGVYLDDQESGFLIYGNIFERVYRGVMLGGGRDNRITNNLFIDTGFGGAGQGARLYVDGRGVGFHFDNQAQYNELIAMPYTKSPWKEQYPELLNILCDEPMEPLHNMVDNNVFAGTGDVSVILGAQGKIQFVNNAYALFTVDESYQVSFQGHPERIAWSQIPFASIGRSIPVQPPTVNVLFSHHFANDLSVFAFITESSGMMTHEAVGLNGTAGSAKMTRTGNSPNVYGKIEGPMLSELSAFRMAFFLDASNLRMGADGGSAILWYPRDGSGGARLGSFRMTQINGLSTFQAQVLPDTDLPMTATLTPGMQPAWVEIEVVSETTDGANDGQMRFYLGGGDYPANGLKVAEFLSVQNYVDFHAVENVRMGLQFGSALVTGSLVIDEIMAVGENTPILVGD